MVPPNRRLPWYTALGAFVVFGLTLSHGLTANSLALAAKVAGWDWQPMPSQPVLWLLTLPLRCLPASWVPFSLNLFTAVCAALILGLLVRSVELLLGPRLPRTLPGWKGLLPLLLAGVVCGLEFRFWREATAATGEMLDLLLLAGALWCLLEYGRSRQVRWLEAAALAWGLGLAQNWVMLLTWPLFMIALVWLRRERFFDRTFLLRMAVAGLLGFSTYALLPMANGLAPHSPLGLGQAWHLSLHASHQVLQVLYVQLAVVHRSVLVVMALYFLVPCVGCLPDLFDHGTAYQPPVEQFQRGLHNGLRGLFLLACLWLAFDPTPGPRQLLLRQTSVSLPLLTFDYLSGLAAGFLAGSLLLVCLAEAPPHQRSIWSPRLKFWARRLAVPGLALALGGVTVGLLVRNLAAVTLPNRLPLEQFGALALRSLPPGGGIVLSDSPQKLAAFQAALARSPDRHLWLAVDTKSLPSPAYRAALQRKLPAGWLTPASAGQLESPEIVRLLEAVGQSHRLFYLHPGVGHLLEYFYAEPRGLVYELKPRVADGFPLPPLPSAELSRAEALWDAAWPQLSAAREARSQPDVARSPRRSRWANPGQLLLRKLRLSEVVSPQKAVLGEWYSMALNSWGTALQRNGALTEAGRRFDQALGLNPNNQAAQLNWQCNTNLQAGHPLGLAQVEEVAHEVGDAQRLTQFMSHWGPFDDPVICFLLGRAYERSGLPCQAAEQFTRAHTLAPGAPRAELALAEVYTLLGMSQPALQLLGHLRQATPALAASNSLDLQLSLLEANCWLLRTNTAKAREVMRSAQTRYRDDPRAQDLIFQAYMTMGEFTNALQLVTARLARTPDDIAAMVNQASALLQLHQPTNAIPILNRALTLTNLPVAQFNRAIAYVLAGNDPAAEADYLAVEKSVTDRYAVYYGLAEIAQRRHDTEAARGWFQACLTNAPADSRRWAEVHARLMKLEPAPPRH